MKLELSHNLVIRDPTPEIIRMIGSKCTFPNPDYEQAIKMNGRAWGIKPTIVYYDTEDDKIIAPRGILKDVVEFINDRDCDFDSVSDCRISPERQVKFTLNKVTPREYQEEACKSALSRFQGIITATTGAGKTVIGVYIASLVNTPVLWITHTKELLYQSKQAFLDYTDINEDDIGIIGDGEYNPKEITIATIQTLNSRGISDLVDKVGCVIIDETHHVSNNTWSIAGKFPAKYRLGLTGTPYRTDGLRIFDVILGRNIYSVPRTQLEEDKNILKSKVIKVNTEFSYDVGNNDPMLMKHLITDCDRNRLVINIILKALNTHANHILVVSSRVDHVRSLAARLQAYSDIPVFQLCDKETFEYDKTLDKFVLIATYGKATEGLNFPTLDTLIYATPVATEQRLEQSIGRIERFLENKCPIIYDIYDEDYGMLRGKWKKRSPVYINRKMIIEERDYAEYGCVS